MPVLHSMRVGLAKGTSRAGLAGSRSSRRQLCATAGQLTDQLRYIEEVAVMQQPKALAPLIKVLEVQGHAVVSPTERSGLHPLLIPLTQGPRALPGLGQGGDAGGSGSVYVCLLRWHNPRLHKGMSLPVVAMEAGARSVALLGRSADEYIARCLAQERFGADGRPGGAVADAVAAAGGEARELPEMGGGGGGLEGYLVKHAGMFPDVVEALVRGHQARGDQMSALITGEWYMRNKHFSGWARPYEFNSTLYAEAGRGEEARDMARIALRMPWWSLALGFEAVRDRAAMAGGADDVSYALSDEAAAVQRAQQGGFQTPKDPKEKALEAAEALMNKAAAGEAGWDEIRGPLAERYAEAGCSEVADFIRAAA